ncbi:MAG: Skp family chaperone for outer membrane protein [Paracoccaceae bacterium]|jgi:Skp family chaperone for outer membrane proteins
MMLGVAAVVATPAAAQFVGQPVPAAVRQLLVVDRARMLDATAAAAQLTAVEAEVRAAVQARLERVKQELEAEERALTDARATMDPEEFSRRGAAFDRRVRLERRSAQERGARLLKFIEDERAALSARMPPVLEHLRKSRGAALIIDAAAVAAYDADADVTADAVALFDREVRDLEFTPPEILLER